MAKKGLYAAFLNYLKKLCALNVNLFGAILSSVSKLGHKSEICRIWQNVWSLVRTLVLVYWLAIEYHHLSLNLSQVFFVKLFIEI